MHSDVFRGFISSNRHYFASRCERVNIVTMSNTFLYIVDDLNLQRSASIAKIVNALECERRVISLCSIHSSGKLIKMDRQDAPSDQVSIKDWRGFLVSGFGICGEARYSDKGA